MGDEKENLLSIEKLMHKINRQIKQHQKNGNEDQLIDQTILAIYNRITNNIFRRALI
jgi:hypothetical protein